MSEVRTSVLPSDLIKVYLSSSKGKKVSFSPAVTGVDNWLSAIVTLKVFLMVKDALVKSTEDIFGLGKTVYKVSSVDLDNLVPKIFKSETFRSDVDKPPWLIPVTVATPEIEIVVFPTLTTLAYTGKEDDPLLNLTRLPDLTILPGKFSFELVIVLMPPLEALIVAIPTLK